MAFLIAFLIIFILAFVLSLGLQRRGERQWVSITVPVVCLVAFVLFNAYISVYRGGEAEFWPIEILFGAPVALVGGLLGYFISRRFWKSGQGGDTAF